MPGIRLIWLAWLVVWLSATGLFAQEPSDSLAHPDSTKSVSLIPDTIYVIPAGPLAGSFTTHSRIQVVDTVAGWARILVEGWVPVEKVVNRMSSEIPSSVQATAAVEKPPKVKKERPQCTATTSKGKRCKNKAISGSSKCWQHSQ